MAAFADRVREPFAFLVDRGFVLRGSSETEARFESPGGVFVRVFYIEYEQYLGLRVGMATEPRDALTDAEMLATAGASGVSGLYPDRGHLDEGLVELADRLSRYGERALRGDPSVYEEARTLRREHTARYTRPTEH